jgi:hypothetical protein
MPTYTDAPPKTFTVLPEGDYIFHVTNFEIGISTGGKTSGSEKYQVTLEIEGKGADLDETLIDHPNTIWKVEAFLKSCGVVLKKGEPYEFRKDKADETGIRWIDPIGMRGWCKLTHEPYTTKAGKNITVNRVALFYTDKEKLPARKIEDALPFPADDGDFKP